jgi:hypothetical protein
MARFSFGEKMLAKHDARNLGARSKPTINPLMVRGKPYVVRKGVDDLAKAVERISKNFDRVTSFRELRVVTKTERERENQRRSEEMEARQNEESKP